VKFKGSCCCEKVSCPHHPKCPCDVILIDIVRGGHPSFSKCQVCLCVPYTIFFVSFLIVQSIKHLHNTKYFWEAFHKCCPTFTSISIFAMLNFKKFLRTFFNLIIVVQIGEYFTHTMCLWEALDKYYSSFNPISFFDHEHDVEKSFIKSTKKKNNKRFLLLSNG
jgi:hypothetical protein